MTQVVYILHCADVGIYIGCTEDLSERIDRHNKGYVLATKGRLPVNLIVSISFQDKTKLLLLKNI